VRAASVLAILLALLAASIARADTTVPPWHDPADLPIPSWARSVAPKRADVAIFAAPGKIDVRRGTAMAGGRLPFYGAKRGANCAARWLNVGPLAWVCGDAADLASDAPWGVHERGMWAAAAGPDGLPFRYYFVGRDGAFGYEALEHALDDAPDQDYEPGFSVAIVEERAMHGERWGRTNHGKWVALRELTPAHPPAFHGEAVSDGNLEFAWVVSDRAVSRKGPSASAAATGTTHVRFEVVPWREERAAPGGPWVRISEDGVVPTAWMSARDLARPTLSAPPAEIEAGERWIDVDLAAQTLVAYDGAAPVFATLVSTGRGPETSETATPKGVHRVWVKLATTNMDNLERDDAERHYSIEDVPYVQFFDKSVALHGAFWHQGFGRVQSHGCVNLAPLDARWLFAWTSPHLPAGWTAALPSALERGTAVRVR